MCHDGQFHRRSCRIANAANSLQVEGIVEDLVLDGEITDGPAQENLMYVKGHDTLRREPSTTTFTQSDYSISVCRDGR
jgi:hypothetical protein